MGMDLRYGCTVIRFAPENAGTARYVELLADEERCQREAAG